MVTGAEMLAGVVLVAMLLLWWLERARGEGE